MLSRQDIKKQFLRFLFLTSSLPNNGHAYLSIKQIELQEIERFIQSSKRIKIITDCKTLNFPGWLGAVYYLRPGRQYDVFFLSSSGTISLLLTVESVEEIETELAPISDWDGMRNLLGSEPELEDFTQTLPSIRFPSKEEKIMLPRSSIWFWWEKHREKMERFFVAFLTLALTALTWQAWFHWLVGLGVFLSFCYLQINFENQKLNPHTALQNYLYLYSKEMCWIIFFLATHSYAGLLSPLLTMLYAPYRGAAEKMK